MSSKLTDIVWRQIDVPPLEQHLLLAIADNCNDDGHAWPSNEHLQWKTGIPERTVKRFKARWTALGVLEIVGTVFLRKQKPDEPKAQPKIVMLRPGEQATLGRGMWPVYRLNLALLPSKEPWKRGADVAPLNKKKGATDDTLSMEKGANGDAKGCQIEQRNKERTVSIEPSGKEGSAQGALLPLSENPGKTKSTLQRDPRLEGVLGAIRKTWPAGMICDIDGRDVKAVNAFLSRKPQFPGREIEICIVFRSLSEDENHTLPVRLWIGDIDKYQAGPLNKWGDPVYPAETAKRMRSEAETVLYGEQPKQLALTPANASPNDGLDLTRFAKAEVKGPDGNSYSAWLVVSAELEKLISRHKHDTWFKPLKHLGARGKVLFALRPDDEAFADIQDRFHDELEAALSKAAPAFNELQFITKAQAPLPTNQLEVQLILQRDRRRPKKMAETESKSA